MYGFPFWSLPNGLCQARPPTSSRYSRISKSCTEALVSACCGLLTLGSRAKYVATHGSSNPSNAASPILGKLYPRRFYSTQFSQNGDFGLFACSLLVSSLVWHAKGRLNKAACYCAHDRKMRQMHCEALGYLVIGIDNSDQVVNCNNKYSRHVASKRYSDWQSHVALARRTPNFAQSGKSTRHRTGPPKKKKKGRELKIS